MQDLIIDLMEDPEGFKTKVKNGLDVNAQDENGKTVLHHLAISLEYASNVEVKEDIFAAMKVVLDLGAAPHLLDKDGRAAGSYIDQIEENNPALEMIYEAQPKFNPGKYQDKYSPIGEETKEQAQTATAQLQDLMRERGEKGVIVCKQNNSRKAKSR